MNRRYCLVFGAVVLASCSSTDVTNPGSAGAPATAGASGSPAGGSSGASSAGSAGLGTSAGAGNVSGGGATGAVAGAGGAAGGSSGASGANSGAGGAPGGAGGAPGGAGGAPGGAGGKGGSGGASGSGGNSGGAGAPAKFCDGKTLLPAPVVVTKLFKENQVGKDLNLQLTEYVLPDACDEAVEDSAVGSCHEYEYTPEPDGGTVKWQWLSDPAGDPGDKYSPVCLAAGMTKVMFRAKGYVGGEIVTFGASQATPVDVTLTNAWAQYSISLANVNYNSDSQGVQPGFFWTLVETKNPGKASVRFLIDDIKYVNN